MESMACGTLTVASRLSGIPELIEDGQSGFLAEPGDSDALTRAIQTALSKTEAEKQEILSQARAVIEERHDAKKLTQELLNDAETLV